MLPESLNRERAQPQLSVEGCDASIAQSGGASDFPHLKWNHLPGRLGCSIDLWVLGKMLARIGHPPIRMVLWNGKEIVPAVSPPVGSIVIHDRITLWKLAWNASLGFGDAYVSGQITVDGDLKTILTAISSSLLKVASSSGASRPSPRRPSGMRPRSIADSRESVHHHYDIGNDFYKLWLDEQLVYTCAYFPTPDCGLEQAQVAKMNHVCRKLRLAPGMKVVEAGCGWGALALHMAAKYGTDVRAFNLSHEQIAYARERAERAGLASRVEFIEDDYRNISGQYDAFVSVGMLEHVGLAQYAELGRLIGRSLKAAGLGLIHSIGRNVAFPMDAWTEKRIFPGAYPPSLREMMDIFEPLRFSVLDVENLRLHYARTLEIWLERFEGASSAVQQMFDEHFVRAWRLYLAASIATFSAGELQLFQIVFAHGTNNSIPWTRAPVYTQ